MRVSSSFALHANGQCLVKHGELTAQSAGATFALRLGLDVTSDASMFAVRSAERLSAKVASRNMPAGFTSGSLLQALVHLPPAGK